MIESKTLTLATWGMLVLGSAGAGAAASTPATDGERSMATPALVDGVVYVRTDSNLCACGNGKER